jgi:MraZ protein
MNFIGEYIAKLDNKGRAVFPASLRRQLESLEQDKFVLTKGIDKCLVLYPIKEWDKLNEKLNRLNQFVEKNRRFIRQFRSGHIETSLDSAGRILIHKPHLDHTNIKSEVYFVANGKTIEIWAKEKYEEEVNSNSEDFGKLAEDVMGDIDFDFNID